MKKTHEKAVTKILTDMVKAGMILAKRLIKEEEYGVKMGHVTKVKIKPMKAAVRSKASEAAYKSWETRRKNARLKAVRKEAACKAVKTKQKNNSRAARRSAAAHKAWATRRSATK